MALLVSGGLLSAVYAHASAAKGIIEQQWHPVAGRMAWNRSQGIGNESGTITNPGHVHELTFSCYQRQPLLSDDVWRGMLAESINRAMEGHRYRLTAFVFMPEHVHLMVYPLPEADTIAALLRAVKRPFSYRVKQLLTESASQLIERLTMRQRPGVTTFRYWQEGPGYDRNLTKLSTVLAAIDYLHQNPVRRGVVKTAADWKWSSARYYLIDPPRQYPGLPILHSLPAEWLNESG